MPVRAETSADANAVSSLGQMVSLVPPRGTNSGWLKRHAENQLESVLDALDALGRPPDDRESRELLYAMKAIQIGMYAEACDCIMRALMRAHPGRDPFARDYQTETTAQIRDQLALVRQMPVRR